MHRIDSSLLLPSVFQYDSTVTGDFAQHTYQASISSNTYHIFLFSDFFCAISILEVQFNYPSVGFLKLNLML